MSARRVVAAHALVLLALFAACRKGSSNGPRLTSLGLGAESLQGQGDLWVIVVSEANEGGTDLDGDGDANDHVLFVHRLSDGILENLGLALWVPFPSNPFVVVGDVLVAFAVAENEQGASDLNGDGDALDFVLHVYDDNTGLVTNTGLAVAFRGVAIGAGAIAFAVDEAAQDGQDLDGSGSATGTVLHVYDARTRLSTNAQRNVVLGISFHDHAFAFVTDEDSAAADLNGDGDLLDTSVFQLYDLVLGGIVSVPLAIRQAPLAVGVDDWFVLADEVQEGRDLNGDLDTSDGVLHGVDPHLALIQSLDLSSLDSFSSTTDTTDLALVAQEIDGLDRNGDGDKQDSIAVLYDAALDQVHDSGIAIDPVSPFVFIDGWLAFLADEADQGLDLNGDGDELDQILHVMERATGAVTNLGEDVFLLQAAIGRVLFSRSEFRSGLDYNGDGDILDVVVFTWLPPFAGHPAGEITNTALSSNGRALAATAGELLLLGFEAAQGEDLDGDGDLLDSVYVLHDLATSTNRSLRAGTFRPEVGLAANGRGVLLVSELAEGVDLNRDGDFFDHVVHALRVR